MTQSIPMGRTVPLIVLLLVMGACSDGGTVAPVITDNATPPPVGMGISNPQSGVTSTSALARTSVSAAQDSVVYVSLAPNTLPNAANVVIRNRTINGPGTLVPILLGGFDPVPIRASSGDDLELTVLNIGGGAMVMRVKVPAKRPPSVVRSDPPKGRTDVAFNVTITIVFSEPIDEKTASATSIQLLHKGSPVSGLVRFPENSWTAEFVPDKPLDPQTSYDLIVTPDLRDLDGDALDSSFAASFVTSTVANSPCSGYALPFNCPPFPTGGPSAVSGVVSERTSDGIRPVANATVWAWVQTQSGNGYSRGSVKTDSLGRYLIDNVPNASILLYASVEGFDQPCAAVRDLSASNAPLDVELVSQSHPRPAAATTPPLLTGVVYEQTATGRQPVVGAQVGFETIPDLVTATTTTDENGRYALCNLPHFVPIQDLIAFKAGYEVSDLVVSVGTATQQDIELKH